MVSTEKYIPDKGDLVWIDFNPTKGHEQSGRRPAFVVSPRIYNEKIGLALLCPITSKVKNYPFEVVTNGKYVSGVILADQIHSFDWRFRNIIKIETTSNKVIGDVKSKILALIS